MKVVIFIVNYNSWEATKKMLVSANILNISPDIYVLDNNSEPYPGFSFNPKEYYKGSSCLIRLDRNYGYFGAVSEFLSKMQNLTFDWLFIANSDLIFNDTYLFDYLDECSKVWKGSIGVYCPAVISNRTKLDQNPFLKEKPTIFYYYKYKIITACYPIVKVYVELSKLKTNLKKLRITQANRTASSPQIIFAPHGAFVGLYKDFFSKGGFIEHRNFLFHEEEILGYICDKINLKVIYDPRVSIKHEEHVTTGSRYSRQKHNIRKYSLSILKEYMKSSCT